MREEHVLSLMVHLSRRFNYLALTFPYFVAVYTRDLCIIPTFACVWTDAVTFQAVSAFGWGKKENCMRILVFGIKIRNKI